MIPECPRGDGDPRSRVRYQPSPAAEPSQSRRVSGLLSDIRTPIRREPFTDHYTIIPGKELGRGKFAVVRKCVEKCTGHEYAAKFLRKRRKGQDCRTEIIHEIAALELATTSPRVINLHQIYEMASEMVLVLEFAAGGEIFNQCVSDQEDEAFSEDDVRRLMRQILEGVSFLHQNNLVHLDLKPQNILLTSSSPLGDIKIVDFGLSRMVNSYQELREIMGTPEYVAPEILNFEPISTATDMWSAGVLAYVMLTGVSPFLGENKQETFLNISQLNVSYSEEELQQLDQGALSFIQTLLRKRPQDRATAEECLKHPWLQFSEPQETPTVEILLVEEEILPVEEELLPVEELVPVEEEILPVEEEILPVEELVPVEEEIFPVEELLPVEEDHQEASSSSSTTNSPEPPSSTTTADEEEDEEEEGPVMEELIVMAAYTLGQCRQSSSASSSSSEKEALTAEQKDISKRFKFEEPFSALQEVPGEFIY